MAKNRERALERHHEAYERSHETCYGFILVPTVDNGTCSKSMALRVSCHSLFFRVLDAGYFIVQPQWYSTYIPGRSVGRPRLKWDDYIQDFCSDIDPHHSGRHWTDILSDLHTANYEDDNVLFLSNNPVSIGWASLVFTYLSSSYLL
jgi:hypothetical protein